MIEVSLDGLSEEDSDQIRRRSESISVINNVNKLYEYSEMKGGKVKVQVATTQFVEDYSLDFNNLGPAPVPEYLERLFMPRINVKSTWAIQWPGQYPSDSKVVFREPKPVFSGAPSCSLLNDTITIRANGDVVVCCYDLTSLHIVGNVKEQFLDEIWASEEYKNFRESFIKQNFREPCKSCSVVVGRGFLSKQKSLAIVN